MIAKTKVVVAAPAVAEVVQVASSSSHGHHTVAPAVHLAGPRS